MKISQADKILHYMKTSLNGITQKEAICLFGCTRLAARISDLRSRGNVITSESVKVKNRDGTETYVSRYRLEG